MKKNSLIALLFLALPLFSQNTDNETARIAESEMKSAASMMNFVTNPNTANYDITYQKLEFTVNPSVYFITGKVTNTFTALSQMSSVTFDLTNELTVSSVTRNGVSVPFVQNSNNEVVISLPGGLATGASSTVVINYSGEPASGQDAFTASEHNGTPVIYTLSEPYGAQDWFPCKQDLNDKVESIDVYITAPSQYTSVANGVEIGQNVTGNLKTTHFHHGHPIPAYLIAIAVTNYSIFTQQAGTAPNTFPIVNYIYPEDLSTVQLSLAATLPIMSFFEQKFETYPYADEKYGHAQFGWGGGMEHTTVSFMGGFNRGLIAHELGHQWFGDKVTCGSWRDIWLNEGFASYMSMMVIEHLDGQAAYVANKTGSINYITAAPDGAVYLTEAETNSVNRIFSNRLSYNKGAMVLNMLRFKMGDTMFFQALKNYLADPNLAYGYATTPDLQAHLEAVYGSSLTEFFNDWVYKQGYPSYTITAQNMAAGQVKFVINQTQSHSSVNFFEMPVPVRVFGSGGQQLDLILNNTTNNQTFLENVPFVVTDVAFDPNKELISNENSISLGIENFELQSLSLSPNPVSNKLSLKTPEGLTIQKSAIYNASGQLMKETTTQSSWNVSGWASGIYFLDIKTNFGSRQIKFIKK